MKKECEKYKFLVSCLSISLLFILVSIILVSAGQLKVTNENPFLINGKWIPASDLKVGDMITTPDRKKVRITKITDVVVTNENSKPIQDIKIEDKVLSYDSTLKKNVDAKVTNIFKFLRNDYFIIKTNSSNEEIKVTGEHPFFVRDNWVLVKDLKVGDELLSDTGKKTKIIEITPVHANNPFEVYNLEVDGSHNYYANGMLVHNKPLEYKGYVEKWDEDLVDSITVIETPKAIGAREGADFVNVKLKDGTEMNLFRKRLDLKTLREEIIESGNLDENELVTLTDEKIKENIFEQVERVSIANPKWKPLSYIEKDGEIFYFFMEAYVNSNPSWQGGEWDIIKEKIYDSKFYREIKKSPKSIKDKLLSQLEELKFEDCDGVPVLSDGHTDNIMIWIKKENNVIVNIEIRPIDYFDPLMRFNKEYRISKLDWVNKLIRNIKNPDQAINYLDKCNYE